MAGDLDRPYFRPSGRKSLLWYCLYGEFGDIPTFPGMDASGVPDGIQGVRIPRQSERFSAFLGDYFGTLLDENPILSHEVRQAPEMLRISCEREDDEDLGYLAAVIETVNRIASRHGAGILDPQTLTWWTVEDWLAAFRPFTFRARAHAVILKSSDSGNIHWLHTRGMRKFARPDISISGVPQAGEGPALEIIHRFIEFQALGGLVEDGQEVRIRDIPPGMVCRLGGELEDPDFNNLHIAIRWPEADGYPE